MNLSYTGKLLLFNFAFYLSTGYIATKKINSINDIIWHNRLRNAIEHARYYSEVSDKNMTNKNMPFDSKNKKNKQEVTQYSQAYIKNDNLEFILSPTQRNL